MINLKGAKRQPSHKFRAKKSLGQNFLIDQVALQDVVNAIDPQNDELIVEIGPGHGELTKHLIDSGARVVAIEKDGKLASELKLKVKSEKLKVIEGDALEEVKNLKLEVESWKLCGNIPYYITGKLLRVISELEQKPESIVFMLQREVAERICAKKGDMNILAASVQIWARPEIVRLVGKDAFNPRPKVESAIIKLRIRNQESRRDNKKYYELLHILFKQPRKTIWNNLRNANVRRSDLEQLGLNPSSRPQDLSVAEIYRLAMTIG